MGFLLLDAWALLRLKKRPFLQSLIWALCSFLFILAPAFWIVASAPSQPLPGDRLADIHYLDELRSRALTVVPIITASVPWLVILSKYFKHDLVAAALERIQRQKSR